ncbi:MAG: hypothetical protein CMK09_03340 [Ponticaulis sp.]|nr:hypothetical protein [Ponticaulis sp.]|tara:strand:+ start:5824 stop:7806 length:1983 start_codon:yes stop_codon:yes gene_type:complete
MRKINQLRAVALGVVLGGAGMSAPAYAQDTEYFEIQNNKSGLCYGVAGGGTSNGSNVVLWNCTGTEDQKWSMTSNGEIKNKLSGKCLDVSGPSMNNGANIHIWECLGTWNQKWEFKDNKLKVSGRNKCSEPGGSPNLGHSIYSWDCNAEKHQITSKVVMNKPPAQPPETCVVDLKLTPSGAPPNFFYSNTDNSKQLGWGDTDEGGGTGLDANGRDITGDFLVTFSAKMGPVIEGECLEGLEVHGFSSRDPSSYRTRGNDYKFIGNMDVNDSSLYYPNAGSTQDFIYVYAKKMTSGSKTILTDVYLEQTDGQNLPYGPEAEAGYRNITYFVAAFDDAIRAFRGRLANYDYADYVKKKDIRPRGEWVSVCTGGQNCKQTLEKSWNRQKSDTDTTSKTVSDSVALSVSATVGYENEVGPSGSVTVGAEKAWSTESSNIKEIVNGQDEGAVQTCETSVDYNNGSIQGVYAWQTTIDAIGGPVKIQSCTIACTADGRKPNFMPFSNEFVNSCNPELKAAATPAPAPVAPAAAPAAGDAFSGEIRLENRYVAEKVVNVETGSVGFSEAPDAFASAKWAFEKVGDFYRIKNVWKGTYLNVEGGSLQSSDVPEAFHSGQWELVPIDNGAFYMIKNRWKGTFINVESGSLQASDVPPAFWSAHWNLRKM